MTGTVEEPVTRDQLTPAEAVAARVLLGTRHAWNPDMAMRYLPVVRIVRRYGLADLVTDVGSGASGIAPYLRRPVDGVDTAFDGPADPRLAQVHGSVVDLPFPDASRPCVVSVDMLEHLPPDLRARAVDELVRVSGRLLVIAVPCGPAALAHDREMQRRYTAVRGHRYRYLDEHVEYGLPDADRLRSWIGAALTRHGRRARLALLPNAPLPLRGFLMERWIRRGPLDRAAWVAMVWAATPLSLLRGGEPYRRIAVVDLAGR